MTTLQAIRARGLAAPVFWMTASVLVVWGLGTPGLRGSEDRFAEITREMIDRSDFLHPVLNGEPHFHKPLLSYWFIALASWAVADLGELAARLPSALAGLLALGATVRLGRELWSPAVGRCAGWILLGTYGFLLWARTAAADMENLAAVILAVTWFRCREERPGLLLYSGFAMICAVGAHAKGLAAIALPLLVLMPHLARYDRFRDHFRFGELGVAVVLGALVYFAPFVWADVSRGDWVFAGVTSADPESGLYMVFQENVRRFYAPHDHQGAIYTYLLALPVLLLPWALVFLATLLECFLRRGRLDPEARWLLWSIGLIFVVFTVAGSRRSYYILPILPFCALLVSVALDVGAHRRAIDIALRWTSAGMLIAMGLEAVAALVAWPLGWFASVHVPLRLVPTTGALAVAAFAIWRRRDALSAGVGARLGIPAAAAIPVTLSVVVLGGYFALQYPILDRLRTEKPFALALRDATRGLEPDRVAFVGHVPALFPFYMDRAAPIPVLRSADEVRAFGEGDRGLVVLSTRSLGRIAGAPLARFSRPPDLAEKLHPWDSEDERLGAWWVGNR